jgi:LAS superfamily LD-carboxypeptidase LdcB
LRIEHCDGDVYGRPASACSPPTARPGSSQHELGLAIDFENCASRATPCYQWLAEHAAEYGFKNLPSEAWHWSTTGS